MKRLKAVDTLQEDGHSLTDLACERVAKDLNEHSMPAEVARKLEKKTRKIDKYLAARIIGTNSTQKANLKANTM